MKTLSTEKLRQALSDNNFANILAGFLEQEQVTAILRAGSQRHNSLSVWARAEADMQTPLGVWQRLSLHLLLMVHMGIWTDKQANYEFIVGLPADEVDYCFTDSYLESRYGVNGYTIEDYLLRALNSLAYDIMLTYHVCLLCRQGHYPHGAFTFCSRCPEVKGGTHG